MAIAAMPSWLAVWNATAIVLFLRSLAVPHPSPPSWQIACMAIFLCLIANFARWQLMRRSPWATRDQDSFDRWLPMALSPGAIIFSLWLSNLQPLLIVTVTIWMILVISEAVAFVNCFPNLLLRQAASTTASVRGGDPSVKNAIRDDDQQLPLSDDVDQRIERRSVDGNDVVSGLVRARFEPGQRIASVWIGFVPPLIPEPTGEAEAVWGSEASVKIADIHPQGIQFELRRESVDDGETSTIVEFFASARPMG